MRAPIPGITVVVTGSKDYDNTAKVYEVLDALLPIRLLLHGGCPTLRRWAIIGIDAIAETWSVERRVDSEVVKAPNRRYGLQNKAFLAHNPDIVVIFSSNRGTSDLIKRARKIGVQIQEVP
jgi:hypothetical protein